MFFRWLTVSFVNGQDAGFDFYAYGVDVKRNGGGETNLEILVTIPKKFSSRNLANHKKILKKFKSDNDSKFPLKIPVFHYSILESYSSLHLPLRSV